jgi:hypothetical protein
VNLRRVAADSKEALAEPRAAALLVLVYLRKSETFAGLAAGFGVGTATAWRYVLGVKNNEAVGGVRPGTRPKGPTRYVPRLRLQT